MRQQTTRNFSLNDTNSPNIIWLNGGDIRGDDSLNTWNKINEALQKYDPDRLVTFHPFGRTTSSEWFHDENWLDFNMYQSGHRSYDLDTSANEHRFGPINDGKEINAIQIHCTDNRCSIS